MRIEVLAQSRELRPLVLVRTWRASGCCLSKLLEDGESPQSCGKYAAPPADWNTFVLSAASAKSRAETGISFSASFSYRTRMATIPAGLEMPAGFGRTSLMTLKIAVFAPIPAPELRQWRL